MSSTPIEETDHDPEPDQPTVATQDRMATRGQATSQTSAEDGKSRFEFLKTLTIYDAMLIASALSISLAVVLMLIELTSFGGIFSFQWRTSEAYAEPLTPPG